MEGRQSSRVMMSRREVIALAGCVAGALLLGGPASALAASSGWEVMTARDKWGDAVGYYIEHPTIRGRFSNSATEGDRCDFDLRITENEVQLRIDEYGWAGSFAWGDTTYSLEVRDAQKNVHSFKALHENDDNVMYLSRGDSSSYEALVELFDSGKIDIYLEHGKTTYLFSVDSASSFRSAFRKAFPEKARKIWLFEETVKFGSYPQSGSSPEPIEWIVLDKQGDRKLLLAKYALDCKKYNEKSEDVTWKGCTLRSWLNGEFLSNAFSSNERSKIVETKLSNPKNPDYGTRGDDGTTDKVFCLSIDEVCDYFGAKTWKQSGLLYEQCITRPTDYVDRNNARINVNTGGCVWWLRSPGRDAGYAACVLTDGGVYSDGNGVGCVGVAVRPALWVSNL